MPWLVSRWFSNARRSGAGTRAGGPSGPGRRQQVQAVPSGNDAEILQVRRELGGRRDRARLGWLSRLGEELFDPTGDVGDGNAHLAHWFEGLPGSGGEIPNAPRPEFHRVPSVMEAGPAFRAGH